MGETLNKMFSAEEIDRRVSELAAEIKNDYGSKLITMVGALRGAVIFMSDLARKLDNNVEFEFIRTASYGSSSTSEGNVKLELLARFPFTGRNILLIEDIVDSGHTLAFLQEYISGQDPESFKICALLDKPDRRVNHEAKFDYLGFTIPDKFIVGYGLDYDQKYRNLPYIGYLEFDQGEDVNFE